MKDNGTSQNYQKGNLKAKLEVSLSLGKCAMLPIINTKIPSWIQMNFYSNPSGLISQKPF
jgi:hypothetical protein